MLPLPLREELHLSLQLYSRIQHEQSLSNYGVAVRPRITCGVLLRSHLRLEPRLGLCNTSMMVARARGVLLHLDDWANPQFCYRKCLSGGVLSH